MSELKNRISSIIGYLTENLHERDEVVSVAFLSALSDQNIFLFGPPGTAKSLISRRLSKAFATNHYFEYLMQRFSTPEEIFGPVSILELKKDNYVRKTEGFLPAAEFAFLDEIWKSSPAILNTLLTLINEKIFRNGHETVKCPLHILISASNETPPKGQGLEALYDRFLTRLYVPPIENKQNFESLLQSGSTDEQIKLPENLLIKKNELEEWKQEIANVKLSDETIHIIHDIRLAFEQKGKKFEIYVSDRRWQKASFLLKAGAFFCGRESTNLIDTLLLRHCLWTTEENREKVISIVENAVKNNVFKTDVSMQSINKKKESLEQEIKNELYHSDDIYETVNINNTEYFEYSKEIPAGYYTDKNEIVTFYIPLSKMKTKGSFHPVDKNNDELKWIKCEFNAKGTVSININIDARNDSYKLDTKIYWKFRPKLIPKILFSKGSKKTEVNKRFIDALQKAVLDLKKKIETTHKIIDTKREQLRLETETPFVPVTIRNLALAGIDEQYDDIELMLKDCDRLKSLIG